MTVFICPHCQQQAEWLTIKEAATTRQVHYMTIVNWLKKGLEHVKLPNGVETVLILREDLISYTPNREGRPLKE